MKNKLLTLLMTGILSIGTIPFLSAGGLPEDNLQDITRELAETQNELERQKNRADDLERELGNLNTKFDTLSAREPSQTSAPMTVEREDFPVHGYFSASYADSELDVGTFDQETVNIWYLYELNEKFSFFGDIGFQHGTEISVDLGEVEGVGDIIVAEAYLNWKAIGDALEIKFGKFYTPFGQWSPNEIAPTTNSVFDPLLVRNFVPPVATTGIQGAGKINIAGMTLSQAFYVGNGKSTRPHSDDLNQDKALGGRIGLTIPFGFQENNGFTFGVSGFLGRDDQRNDFQEKIWGLDALLKIGMFSLRGETVKSRLNVDEFSPGEEGHIWRSAWFLQAGVHFLEKFDAFYRHDKGDEDFLSEGRGEIEIDSIGVAYRPIEPVVFKGEYDWYDWEDENIGTYEVISGQVAVLF